VFSARYELDTNNAQNDTKQTTQKLGKVRTVPCLCGFYPGICLTAEGKAREKNLSQGSHTYTTRIHRHNNIIFWVSSRFWVQYPDLSWKLYVVLCTVGFFSQFCENRLRILHSPQKVFIYFECISEKESFSLYSTQRLGYITE